MHIKDYVDIVIKTFTTDLVIQVSDSACRYQQWKVNNAMLALYALVRQQIKVTTPNSALIF